MRVFILGAGKVGRAIATLARKNGCSVTLRPGRKALPRKPLAADLVILAVRDRHLGPLAESLVQRHLVPPKAVVVHAAGSLGPEPLAVLRGHCAGVAQMHPMISFADAKAPPSLARGNLRVAGDEAAVQRASTFGKRYLGMTPRRLDGVDPVRYHAAAAFVANGGAALAALGVAILAGAGVPEAEAPKLLGPLLRSVAENIERLGFPTALTGPVRRGESASVEKHGVLLEKVLGAQASLYWALVLAQVPLARAIGDAPESELKKIRALADSHMASVATRGIRTKR